MLKSRLLHPEILEALGRAGHGSKILSADGNYPFATQLGPNARLVSLNVSPGLVNATQVLEAIVSAVPIEEATVMNPMTSEPRVLEEDPLIWADFEWILKASGSSSDLKKLERSGFFDLAKDRNVALTIATAEQRFGGNLLLQIGGVSPESAQ
jgi:L-fucose mutarotase